MIQNCKLIIVENNGLRPTFLDELGCEVYYTNNNSIDVKNKGYKELKDVFDVIEKYTIQDTDFIVKITGRYLLDDDSEFIEAIKNLDTKPYDCIIKYGSYYNPVDYKMNDCITGLIGMRAYFVKKIQLPKDDNECVEWNWAKVTYLIPDESILKVNRLGICIFPLGDTYYV